MDRTLFLPKAIASDSSIEDAVNVDRDDDQPSRDGKSATATHSRVNLVQVQNLLILY